MAIIFPIFFRYHKLPITASLQDWLLSEEGFIQTTKKCPYLRKDVVSYITKARAHWYVGTMNILIKQPRFLDCNPHSDFLIQENKCFIVYSPPSCQDEGLTKD